MFENFKAKRAAAQAQKEAAAQAATIAHEAESWQAQHDNLESLITAAQTPGTIPDGLVAHRGELCYATLTNCSLVEERKGPSHFVAGSQGLSIPIGSIGGHSVRYRVGQTRGHVVQGTPTPTAIATGTMYVTNQRICFLSPTQTREVRLDKLVGMQRDDHAGTLTLSVANRQHPVVIAYGASVAGWVGFHLDLALSQWRGDVDQFIANLQAQLTALEASKPGGAPAAPSSQPPSA